MRLPIVLCPIGYLYQVFAARRQSCKGCRAQVARTSPSSTTSSCDAAQGGKFNILQMGRSIGRANWKFPPSSRGQFALVGNVSRQRFIIMPKLCGGCVFVIFILYPVQGRKVKVNLVFTRKDNISQVLLHNAAAQQSPKTPPFVVSRRHLLRKSITAQRTIFVCAQVDGNVSLRR